MFYVARNKETKQLLILPVPVTEKVLSIPVWSRPEDAQPYLKAMHIADENVVEELQLDAWRELKARFHSSWTHVLLHLMETGGKPNGAEV